MGLMSSSSPVCWAPPIYHYQHHLAPPIKAAPQLHFPNMSVIKRLQSKRRASFRAVKVEENIEDEACELVNGTQVSIDDDEAQAYLFTAVKNNNETGILLLSDIFGFQDSATRDFAYRVACNGYNVLVPDLFNGDPWRKDRGNEKKLEEWISKHEEQVIAKTITASAKWMKNAGISKKLGIIGLCYGGGRVIEILGRDEDDYFGCGVSFYGTRMDSSAAANIKVGLLMITGDNDELCPLSILEDITKTNQKTKMVVFPGRAHGFVHRPQTPEEDADAEEAFVLMRNWLHDGLILRNSHTKV